MTAWPDLSTISKAFILQHDQQHVDLENGFRLLSKDRENLDNPLTLEHVAAKMTVIIETKDPHAWLQMNGTAMTNQGVFDGEYVERVCHHNLTEEVGFNLTGNNQTDYVVHELCSDNHTGVNYSDPYAKIYNFTNYTRYASKKQEVRGQGTDVRRSIRPAFFEGQRIELVNYTATFLNSALLTLRYRRNHKYDRSVSFANGTTVARKGRPAHIGSYVDDAVTVKIVNRTQVLTPSMHKNTNIVWRDRVLDEGSVPIYLMPTPSKPKVVVDEKTFDPVLKFERKLVDLNQFYLQDLRYDLTESQYERAVATVKHKPVYVFNADHQHPFVELGTVFSFRDIISYGSVEVSCAACDGFYMQ